MTDSPSEMVDWSAALNMVNGDRELLTEVIQVLVQDLPRLQSGVNTSIAEQDGEALRRSAHSLKGSVRFLGDTEVFEHAQRLEQMGAKSEWTHVKDTHEALRLGLEKMVRELEDYCRS